MKLILLVIIPVALLSYFLAGGFVSPFPQKVVIPSGEPRSVVSNTSPGAGKQLQINTFKFVPPPSPSPQAPASQSPVACQADNAKKNNCSCPYLVSFGVPEVDGVLCENAINQPSIVHGTYQSYNSPQTCPDGGLPCSVWKNDLPGRWGCTTNTCLYISPNAIGLGFPGNPNYGTYAAKPECAARPICFGKPVIYLYPDRIMQVGVKLDIPGTITESIPHYPLDGWQNITAYPGGLFNYQGKTYNELYYESSVNKNFIPKEGYLLPTSNLPTQIDSILIKMGLIPRERAEFLDYWLPKLTALNKPYIFMGFLEPEQKEQVDKVIVTPKPDTTIAFLAYFRGITTPFSPISPTLPTIPARKGFTMVEWGGTIDN